MDAAGSPVRFLSPDLIQQVARLDLRARFIVEGFLAGLHASPFQGFSVEFSEHRKYVQGDDLRTIDWNVFARTDRLYVRKYVAETNLDCHLFVDASASMGPVGLVPEPESQAVAAKLLYAVHLGAALGYLITRQQDAVGLCVLRSGLDAALPPRSRRADFANLLGVLAGLRPDGESNLLAAGRAALARIRHRGVVVLLSDLLAPGDDARRLFREIRFRGHDLIVFHILDADEVRFPYTGPLRLEDPEADFVLHTEAAGLHVEYQAAIREWRDDLRRAAAEVRADFVPLDTSQPFDRALVEFLAQRSRRR